MPESMKAKKLAVLLKVAVLISVTHACAATALLISEFSLCGWRISTSKSGLHVARACVDGKFGKPKSKGSKRSVPKAYGFSRLTS
jgi:hypothetical protein